MGYLNVEDDCIIVQPYHRLMSLLYIFITGFYDVIVQPNQRPMIYNNVIYYNKAFSKRVHVICLLHYSIMESFSITRRQNV